MRFINLTRKIARWTRSSVRGGNEPSKPIRIKKIHSHLIKYKKRFIMNEDQNLVTEVNVNPTTTFLL